MQSGPPCLPPESLESYLEHPLQRLHVAAFALHDGAQDVPPDHLPGPETQSVPAPARGTGPAPARCTAPGDRSLCPGKPETEGQKGPVPPRAHSWDHRGISFQSPCRSRETPCSPDYEMQAGGVGTRVPCRASAHALPGMRSHHLSSRGRRPPPPSDSSSR